MSVTIDCPEGGDVPHNVVPYGSGSGPLGYICAHGEANRDFFLQDEPQGKPPTEPRGERALIAATLVYAEIFATFNPNDPNYFQPPDTAIEIPVDDGAWRSEHVPGARHSSTEPYPSNVLVVWAVFAGTGTQTVRVIRNFPGKTADVVSCCEGSGSGALRALPNKPGVALDLAPLLWILWVAGFEAGRQIFNGSWTLQLRAGGIDGHCVWDNGGDGISRPRIQLSCESPLAVEWRLNFEADGGDPIVYARSALDWNPVGSNSLVLARNGSRGVIPEAMTVIPG